MPTPLTDAINALTRYANETTGQSDTTLSDAVETLVSGYGQGGGTVTEAEEKDVNFYDYDGTRVYSYTFAEWANVSELPPFPTHIGLTAQRWSWDKSTIDEYVANVGGTTDVGIYYITSDGKTRIYFELPYDTDNDFYLGLCISGTVTVDWGDGTSDTVTGSSATTPVYTPHTYARGSHIISLTVPNGSLIRFRGNNNVPFIFNTASTNGTNLWGRFLYSTIKKVELGANTRLDQYAFQWCYQLESISTHEDVLKGISSFVNSFYGCGRLRALTVPWVSAYIIAQSGVEHLLGDGGNGQNAYRDAYSLKNRSYPSILNQIGNSAFQNCYSLKKLYFSNRLTSIGTSAFVGCYGILEYHFRSTTPPTLENTNAFSNLRGRTIIYVPYSEDHSVLEAYQTATNWSAYASFIQEEPQG